MKVGIMVVTGPYQVEASDTALKFAEAALKKGHSIEGVFLFMDGVYNINRNVNPSGERNIIEKLSKLGEKVPITACAACGQFRGMKKDFCAENMRMGGLGDLVKLIQKCDRFITFGG